MARLTLQEILQHAHAELIRSERVLALHQADNYGMCACLRPLPCPIAERWTPYTRHWKARIEYFQGLITAPTQPLRTVSATGAQQRST